jgi:hypothetical protein
MWSVLSFLASVHPGESEKSISKVEAHRADPVNPNDEVIMTKIVSYGWLNTGPKSQKREWWVTSQIQILSN